jgi:hypothetical protein
MDGGAAGRETIDYVAITRLQAAYADVVNRRAWPELQGLFLADAVVQVDTVTNPPIKLVGRSSWVTSSPPPSRGSRSSSS